MMFGDEWILQGWTLDEQVDALRWFERIVHDPVTGNPDCQIAFGGVLVWHPSTGSNLSWLAAFRNRYVQRYGEKPQIDAIVCDSYDWPGRNWAADSQAFADEAHRVYGDVEVWAREVGCLLSHECALDSVAKLGDVVDVFDRYAFFVSEGWGEGWGYTSLMYPNRTLTDVGDAYAAGGR